MTFLSLPQFLYFSGMMLRNTFIKFPPMMEIGALRILIYKAYCLCLHGCHLKTMAMGVGFLRV